MKFSHSLQFNSVPDWADKYLAYSNLKKSIYDLEKESVPRPSPSSYRDRADDIEHESAALLSEESRSDTDPIFLPLIDSELRKIVTFYQAKEQELFLTVTRLQDDLVRAEDEDVGDFRSDGEDSEDEEMDDAADMRGGGGGTGTQKMKRRQSLEAVFNDPQQYNEASRLQRELRTSGSAGTPRPDLGRHRSTGLSDAAGLPLDSAASSGADGGQNEFPFQQRKRSDSQSRTRWNFLRPKRSRRQSLGLMADTTLNTEATSRMGGSGAAESEEGASSGFGEGKAFNIWTAQNDYAIDMRITFKRRITEIFVALSELQQFVSLNETGMKKILKKYDKITSSSLKDRYLSDVVKKQYPFTENTKQGLDGKIRFVSALYAKVVTSGDQELALSQLKTHLREQVVWQRNTVWREMIGIERRAQGATLERQFMGQGKSKGGQPEKPTRIWTPCGRVVLPNWLGIPTLELIIAALALTLLLKAPQFRFFARVEEQNCLAMLIFCTILWATEVIPLFVTSFLVPLLVVVLQVARTDDIEDRRMSAPETAKWIFLQMFAPNMCLLLGGFTLAAALSKYGIDKILATKVLRLAGTRPSLVLLAHMCVACFASMWISNVAAPVLMYSLIQPILRTLPPKSSYASSLIMGIALAANIGGQTSPIASPQNLIALQYMAEPVGWLQWFAITVPVSGLSLVAIWLILLWVYGSGRGVTIRRIAESSDSFTGIQYFISGVTVATILLWCFEKKLEYILGDMGVVAISESHLSASVAIQDERG